MISFVGLLPPVLSFVSLFINVTFSTKSIFEEDSPSATTTIALIVTIIEAFGGFGLALYKYVVGKAVRSPVVVAGLFYFTWKGKDFGSYLCLVMLCDVSRFLNYSLQ